MSKLHGCSSLVATCAAASDRAQHMHAPCPDRRGRARAQVTLVIPWLAAADQEMIFPNNQTFETPEAQEQFVRAWARKRTGMPCDFKARVASSLLCSVRGHFRPHSDRHACKGCRRAYGESRKQRPALYQPGFAEANLGVARTCLVLIHIT